jgi:hypothetical protein
MDPKHRGREGGKRVRERERGEEKRRNKSQTACAVVHSSSTIQIYYMDFT